MQKQFFLFVPLCAAAILWLSSCANETEINKVMGSGSEAPVFISYRAESGSEITFQFSTPVKVVSAFLDTGEGFEPFPDEYTSKISLRFLSDHSGGRSITADLLVEDAEGNSLNVLVPFKTRNERIPALVINEIRLDYINPSVEFIELRTKTSGNLGALRLFVASTSIDEAVYEFPPVEVAAGEYITLHLRTLEGDKAVDELGSELNLSSAAKSSDTKDDARDLWVAGAVKYLHTADVIYLTNQDDIVLDGLAIAKDSVDWDKNKNLSKAAEFLAKQGAWLSAEGDAVKTPSAADAVNSSNTTPTRTLCRDETKADGNTLADWYTCDTSGASPGGKNSVKRYTPKAKSVSKAR
ncbi:MAG: hypothetical protein LBC27_01785 [Spirochaetaceae bacterium]|jgi:hypothetical protein|nr:hypothetical protein [Spirochaetaceae bacterium]